MVITLRGQLLGVAHACNNQHEEEEDDDDDQHEKEDDNDYITHI